MTIPTKWRYACGWKGYSLVGNWTSSPFVRCSIRFSVRAELRQTTSGMEHAELSVLARLYLEREWNGSPFERKPSLPCDTRSFHPAIQSSSYPCTEASRETVTHPLSQSSFCRRTTNGVETGVKADGWILLFYRTWREKRDEKKERKKRYNSMLYLCTSLVYSMALHFSYVGCHLTKTYSLTCVLPSKQEPSN